MSAQVSEKDAGEQRVASVRMIGASLARRKRYLLIEYAGARDSGAAQIAVLHCENGATSAPELCLRKHLSNRLARWSPPFRRRFIDWKCSGTP